MVEASAAADNFITRSSLNLNLNESEVNVEPLQGFVVAFPTMNAIHGQDSWWAEYVSEKYADHSAWDVRVIIEMLQKFFAVSGAISLPDLAEYEWRLDKVRIYTGMQEREDMAFKEKCVSLSITGASILEAACGSHEGNVTDACNSSSV